MSALKTRAIGLTSFLLGVVSVIWGYWLLAYFFVAVLYYTMSDPGQIVGPSWRTFIFFWTRPADLAYLLGWIGITLATGGIGYGLVRRRPRDRSVSLAASAARLCMYGLAGAFLDLGILALMLGYRAYRWFG